MYAAAVGIEVFKRIFPPLKNMKTSSLERNSISEILKKIY